MKYIRTEKGNIYNKGKIVCSAFREDYCSPNWNEDIEKYLQEKIVVETDTIEELIQPNDIVFYWQQSDDKEHCALMVYNVEIETIKHSAITKILIPVGNDYKCVAKAEPSFELIKGRRYLVKKGDLELL